MKPLAFVRELYCLNPHYRRYLGTAASLRGCPTTAGAYARFRALHPVLFGASGFSDHPYNLAHPSLPPSRTGSSDPDWAEFAAIPRLEATLDRIQKSYGSSRRFQIWNTEYGYITCPPTCSERNVSPATAAAYINWAEYLSWRNPRIASTSQYLLYDPNPRVNVPEYGGFANGLVFYSGIPKPVYYAYRMPIFLPHTTARRGHQLEVWGDVRPAPLALADGDGPQYAQIQYTRRGTNHWTTLKTIQITSPHGYIDTHTTFPATGSVRLQWTYPTTDQTLKSTLITNSNGKINSRTTTINITR
jgi:hypothetical protein